MQAESNVKLAVPFLGVSDMGASLQFYMDGLGFEMKHQWVDQGQLRWCWLELGDAAIMLQEFAREGQEGYRPPDTLGKLGQGITICFQCRDALAIYREVTSRGVKASRPSVGNAMWVTSLTDPDGYRLDFESPTDAPEESEYNEGDGACTYRLT